MVRNLRARLLRLARRDYNPGAWRRQDDVSRILSLFQREIERLSERHEWIPYSMFAVDEVCDALRDGSIQLSLVRRVIRNAYLRAFEGNRSRITRSMVRMAINEELFLQG